MKKNRDEIPTNLGYKLSLALKEKHRRECEDAIKSETIKPGKQRRKPLRYSVRKLTRAKASFHADAIEALYENLDEIAEEYKALSPDTLMESGLSEDFARKFIKSMKEFTHAVDALKTAHQDIRLLSELLS